MDQGTGLAMKEREDSGWGCNNMNAPMKGLGRAPGPTYSPAWP